MALTFVGDDGKLHLNNDDDGEWRYWNLVDGDHVEEPLPGIDSAWTWDKDYENAFENAARHVLSLLDGDGENRSPGVEATRSLEIIVAFYVSHYTGARVDVPLDRPLRDVTIFSGRLVPPDIILSHPVGFGIEVLRKHVPPRRHILKRVR